MKHHVGIDLGRYRVGSGRARPVALDMYVRKYVNDSAYTRTRHCLIWGGIRASIPHVHFAAANAFCRGKLTFAAPKAGPGHMPRQISPAGTQSIVPFFYSCQYILPRQITAPEHLPRQNPDAAANIASRDKFHCASFSAKLPRHVPARIRIRPFCRGKGHRTRCVLNRASHLGLRQIFRNNLQYFRNNSGIIGGFCALRRRSTRADLSFPWAIEL